MTIHITSRSVMTQSILTGKNISSQSQTGLLKSWLSETFEVDVYQLACMLSWTCTLVPQTPHDRDHMVILFMVMLIKCSSARLLIFLLVVSQSRWWWSSSWWWFISCVCLKARSNQESKDDKKYNQNKPLQCIVEENKQRSLPFESINQIKPLQCIVEKME